jgi:5-methylcytosine-specific restriction endonuclease McrA
VEYCAICDASTKIADISECRRCGRLICPHCWEDYAGFPLCTKCAESDRREKAARALRKEATLSPRQRQDAYEKFERSDKICGICGEKILPGEAMHIDHILPVSRGGTNDTANLRVVHASCNQSKGHKTDEEHAPFVALHAAWDYSGEYDGEVLAGEPHSSIPLSHPDHTVTIDRVEQGLFGVGWTVECTCGWREPQPIRPEVDAAVASIMHEYSLTHVIPSPLKYAEHEVEVRLCRGPGYDGWPVIRRIGQCVCGYQTVACYETELDAAIQEHWDSLESD